MGSHSMMNTNKVLCRIWIFCMQRKLLIFSEALADFTMEIVKQMASNSRYWGKNQVYNKFYFRPKPNSSLMFTQMIEDEVCARVLRIQNSGWKNWNFNFDYSFRVQKWLPSTCWATICSCSKVSDRTGSSWSYSPWWTLSVRTSLDGCHKWMFGESWKIEKYIIFLSWLYFYVWLFYVDFLQQNFLLILIFSALSIPLFSFVHFNIQGTAPSRNTKTFS